MSGRRYLQACPMICGRSWGRVGVLGLMIGRTFRPSPLSSTRRARRLPSRPRRRDRARRSPSPKTHDLSYLGEFRRTRPVKIFALSDLRVTMGQKGGKGNTAGARSERVVRGEGKGRSCRLDRDAAGLIRNERSGSLRGRTSNKPRLSCRRWRRRYLRRPCRRRSTRRPRFRS